ncbi:hypothetical protein GCM10009122_22190 [Fulvivirga kasyanovii]|uniref:DUF4235 domain-containing protein n=1 Tax=Fulvivirga kasyanovii TaxID=396812 RepID=A0ABW9RWL5_9BACT|nr:hypothetical protein [Fulvivirga kasyanovii]MTI28426.1 hypothetical protein [Fulvivirga kasyanovii]
MISEAESNRKKKENLEQNSQKHREAFEHELSEVVDRTKRIATSALVIGGSFALSYYLIKKLTSKKSVKKIKRQKSTGDINEVVIQKHPSVFSTVGNVILTEMAVFLLGIAKERLINYIENLNSRDDEDSKDA